MHAFGRLRAWLRAVMLRRRLEREMHEEMEAHVAQAAQRFRARGMSDSDALQAARREFGPLGAVQAVARDARGGQWLESVVGDLKYAYRYFARTPLSTVTMAVMLALGIGFSSAVFSVINGLLTNPAPGVPRDPALVKIRGIKDVSPFARRLSYPELATYAAATEQFASVAGWTARWVAFDAGDVVGARALFVTPNYFSTLGVALHAGRGFGQSRFDERFTPELTAILSHAFAEERYGDAAEAVGKRVAINGVGVTIVGVAAERFNGAVQSGEARTLWLPLSAWMPVAKVSEEYFESPATQEFDALARLRDGVTIEETLPIVRVIAQRSDVVARTVRPHTFNATADVVPLRGLKMEVNGRYGDDMGPIATSASIVAVLVLLLCTTTVNSLLVGAAVARRYEIGVRLALGASRRRVVRQLLTEIAIIAIAGGALGMWGFGALSRITEVAQDGFEVSPDWRTVAFTLLYAVLTAAICGLSPAVHATRTGLAEVMKDSSAGATRRSRLQSTFVAAQIAIATPLMILLALVIANISDDVPRLGDLTVRHKLLLAEFDTHAGAGSMPADRLSKLMSKLEEVPGIDTVLMVGHGKGWVSLEHPPESFQRPSSAVPLTASAAVYDIPPGYFAMVEAPILRGREFAASDTLAAVLPVIISDTLAVTLFKSGDPIGRRIKQVAFNDERSSEVEVIGVVRMSRETNTLGFADERPPIFVPYRGQDGRLFIRAPGRAETLIPSVLAAVKRETPTLPVVRMNTLAQRDREIWRNRIGALGAVSGFGMIGLLFASIGLYGMLSVAVGLRRREIGVRVALGAESSQVVGLFFRSGMRVAMVGMGIGLALTAVAIALAMNTMGLTWQYIPGGALMVTLTVLGVAALASWVPARAAARVDPMIALRAE
jgi:putative ABC transport system permease protein